MESNERLKGKQKDTPSINTECKISKFDILLINNGWNDKNETLIASIGENAEVFKWMHEKASKRYYLLNRITGIVIVIMNAILSAQTTFSGTEKNTSDIFQKILIYLVTILSVINNFLNYQELATNHKNASSHFREITHEVQQQMCLYRKDRENAVKYVQHTLKKYDATNTNSPAVPDYILRELNKKYKNSGISMPDKMQKIDIITQPGVGAEVQNDVQNDIDVKQPGHNDIEMSIGAFKVDNYNPLKIHGDITEADAEQFSDYLDKSKNAQFQYQFYDRWTH